MAAAALADNQGIEQLLATLKAVDVEGQGHRPATHAWAELTLGARADDLPTILTAIDGAKPLAANWLRAAVDTIAERQVQRGGELPTAALEKFLSEKNHNPRRSAAGVRVDRASRSERQRPAHPQHARRSGPRAPPRRRSPRHCRSRHGSQGTKVGRGAGGLPQGPRGGPRPRPGESRDGRARQARSAGRPGPALRLCHGLEADRTVRQHQGQRLRRDLSARRGHRSDRPATTAAPARCRGRPITPTTNMARST